MNSYMSAPLHPFNLELTKFFIWLQQHHPVEAEKYSANFDRPVKKGGKITVNNSFNISYEWRQHLIAIVRAYYKEPGEAGAAE